MPGHFTTSISPTQGFHFSLTTTLLDRFHPSTACPSNTKPTLALRYIIPPSLFVDPYELELHRASSPFPFEFDMSYEPDLELPVFAARQEDAVVSLKAMLPVAGVLVDKITIPVHARYGAPKPSGGERGYHRGKEDDAFETVQLSPPDVMLSCLPISSTDASSSSHTPLLYSALGENAAHANLSVRIPLGRSDDLWVVETGTVLVIIAAFTYLLRAFLRTARRLESIKDRTD